MVSWSLDSTPRLSRGVRNGSLAKSTAGFTSTATRVAWLALSSSFDRPSILYVRPSLWQSIDTRLAFRLRFVFEIQRLESTIIIYTFRHFHEIFETWNTRLFGDLIVDVRDKIENVIAIGNNYSVERGCTKSGSIVIILRINLKWICTKFLTGKTF